MCTSAPCESLQEPPRTSSLGVQQALPEEVATESCPGVVDGWVSEKPTHNDVDGRTGHGKVIMLMV